ncbi:hypothetical protein GCM10018966_055860 [Streptomyces yanii]
MPSAYISLTLMTRTRHFERHSRTLWGVATATVAVSAVICAATPTARADTAQMVHTSGLGPAGPRYHIRSHPGSADLTPGGQEIARPTSTRATSR